MWPFAEWFEDSRESNLAAEVAFAQVLAENCLANHARFSVDWIYDPAKRNAGKNA